MWYKRCFLIISCIFIIIITSCSDTGSNSIEKQLGDVYKINYSIKEIEKDMAYYISDGYYFRYSDDENYICIFKENYKIDILIKGDILLTKTYHANIKYYENEFFILSTLNESIYLSRIKLDGSVVCNEITLNEYNSSLDKVALFVDENIYIFQSKYETTYIYSFTNNMCMISVKKIDFYFDDCIRFYSDKQCIIQDYDNNSYNNGVRVRNDDSFYFADNDDIIIDHFKVIDRDLSVDNSVQHYFSIRDIDSKILFRKSLNLPLNYESYCFTIDCKLCVIEYDTISKSIIVLELYNNNLYYFKIENVKVSSFEFVSNHLMLNDIYVIDIE